LALDFSLGSGAYPAGGTPEQAQIHRHAVFDAFAELVLETCDNGGAVAAALSHWFKQPGAFQPSHTTLTCAAKIVSDSQNIMHRKAAVECAMALDDEQVRGHERDICVHLAGRLVKRHLRANTQPCVVAAS